MRTLLLALRAAVLALALVGCGRVHFDGVSPDAGARTSDSAIADSSATVDARADVDGGRTQLVVFRVPISWADAGAACRAMGGSLAVPADAAEEAEIASGLTQGTEYVWLGLSDRVVEGIFAAEDGVAATYFHWMPGEPNDGAARNEDCVALVAIDASARGWNDTECDDRERIRNYACRF